VPAVASVVSMSRANSPTIGGAAVSLDALHKRYAGRGALRGLSLEVAPGEFLCIVGRSGCGKTTLLRIVAGIEHADSGNADVSAAHGGGPGAASCDVRLMFQDARLLPWKSVIENVRLGMDKAARADAMTALDAVGLAARASDWPAALSGGQRQRVALARALVHRPQLLLLDEPLGALDALTRIEMHALIERLWMNGGFTTLLVTHDVQEAVALADRIIVMDDGRIVCDEVVQLERPRIRASRQFASLEHSILTKVLRGSEIP
jgi:sulfonate transport system ATP-binding protein